MDMLKGRPACMDEGAGGEPGMQISCVSSGDFVFERHKWGMDLTRAWGEMQRHGECSIYSQHS